MFLGCWSPFRLLSDRAWTRYVSSDLSVGDSFFECCLTSIIDVRLTWPKPNWNVGSAMLWKWEELHLWLWWFYLDLGVYTAVFSGAWTFLADVESPVQDQDVVQYWSNMAFRSRQSQSNRIFCRTSGLQIIWRHLHLHFCWGWLKL